MPRSSPQQRRGTQRISRKTLSIFAGKMPYALLPHRRIPTMPSTLTPVTWQVTVERDTPQRRQRLLDLLRPQLERHLAAYPQDAEVPFDTPLGLITLRRQ